MVGHFLLTDTLQSQSDGCQPLWSPRQRCSSLLTLRLSSNPGLDVLVIWGSGDRNALESLPFVLGTLSLSISPSSEQMLLLPNCVSQGSAEKQDPEELF